MDYRSPVTTTTPTENDQTVTGDQAIFTSVRTATGAGYRVVAASRGLRPDEKMDITRRSPSHGAMCDEAENAVGLSAYPLPSGRYCIADSRYDGHEPSARGGQRIRTHAVILETAAYRRFGYNPVIAHEALVEGIAQTAEINPPAPMEALTLRPRLKGGASVDAQTIRNSADVVLALISEVLCGRHAVLSGQSSPKGFVSGLVAALPLYAREKLAISIGIKFSLDRRMQIALIDQNGGGVLRAVRGHNVSCFDAGTTPEVANSAVPRWLGLVKQCWSSGRLRAMERLSNELDLQLNADGLERIAGICLDQLQVDRADANALHEMLGRYAQFHPTNDVEKRLIAHLLERADARAAFLSESMPSA